MTQPVTVADDLSNSISAIAARLLDGPPFTRRWALRLACISVVTAGVLVRLVVL